MRPALRMLLATFKVITSASPKLVGSSGVDGTQIAVHRGVGDRWNVSAIHNLAHVLSSIPPTLDHQINLLNNHGTPLKLEPPTYCVIPNGGNTA
jgi:hypothetical protein